ncbi:MAG: c-type cytochrome [Microthrixaceae bacterium]
MTESPEHLLKRSKERRAAIGGESSASAEDTPTASESAEAPAADVPAVPVAAAAAVEPAPEPPKPLRPEVAAALGRRKIPFWAMPVLAGLPLWAYVYQATLEPPPAAEAGPLAQGEVIYGGCASCHGATGGGGVGPALDAVLEVFPDYRDHMMWVRLGDAGWPGTTYGATKKTKGVGMPGHAALTDAELAEVVLYERVTFGKLDPTSDEYLALVEIAEGRLTFEKAGLGDLSTAAGVDPESLKSG